MVYTSYQKETWCTGAIVPPLNRKIDAAIFVPFFLSIDFDSVLENLISSMDLSDFLLVSLCPTSD